MPFSSNAGKNYIREKLAEIKPKKVLDVGAGAGSLLKRYRRNGQKWTAVEIWAPYITKYKLDEQYTVVINEDARNVEYGEDQYDVAFAGDVLEHMEPQEAAVLLSKLRRAARVVIVSIPIGKYPQGEYDGNPYERHVKDDWCVQDVMHILGHTDEYEVTMPVGTFIYRRQKQPIKIAIYAIAKNEEQFVDTFCASAKDADYVVIADTGSTDKTVERAKANGAIVHNIYIKPWRFDLARNAVVALIPPDADVCISMDLDERLVPGWREEIERHWVKGVTTRMRYLFNWGEGITFNYEKTHSRDGYHWHHPCHEYPRKDPRFVEHLAISDKVLITHHPDMTKSRGQYLDMLWAATQEDPHCPRNAFYYARELTFNARWDDAIVELKRYLALPATLWPNEVGYAMRLLGDSYRQLGQYDTSIAWYRKACAEIPNTREPWFALAEACHMRRDWPEMFGATSRALAIKNRELVYTCDPQVWGWRIHDYHALAAYNIGLYDIAAEHGTLAAELEPQDERLKANLKFYLEKSNGNGQVPSERSDGLRRVQASEAESGVLSGPSESQLQLVTSDAERLA